VGEARFGTTLNNSGSSTLAPLSLFLHRLAREVPLTTPNAPSSLRQGQLKLDTIRLNNNVQELDVYAGENYRITTQHIIVEGLQLWGEREQSAQGELQPIAEAYADRLLAAIARKRNLSIALKDAKTIQYEIEQVNNEAAQRVEGKGKIYLHHSPELWTDKSFGLRGMESNDALVIDRLKKVTDPVVEGRWDAEKQLRINQQVIEQMSWVQECLARIAEKLIKS